MSLAEPFDLGPSAAAAARDTGVRAALAAAACGASVTVDVLRPYAYTKSAPLHTTTATVGERRLELLVKDLDHAALLGSAAAVKPAALHNPLREIGMYRDVLTDVAGTATFLGHHHDERTGRHLLVIELVDGLELCDVGDVAAWRATAHWLGRFHSLGLLAHAGAVPVVHHTAAYYRHWGQRASDAARGSGDRTDLERILTVYDRLAVDRLIAEPHALIHGELYPSNVVIGGVRSDGTLEPGALRVCPVDWETAARGPALLDLAALTTGDWDAADRAALHRAYVEGIAAAGGTRPTQLQATLAACRLHLAVKWIAVFATTSAPAWQARNWVAEALDAAEELGDPGTPDPSR